MDKLEISVKVASKLFYSDKSSFGIFAVDVDENSQDFHRIKLNKYNNITIKGQMPLLETGTLYNAIVTEKVDPKYGLGYEVSTIYSKPVTTKEEAKIFLMTILTTKQAEGVINAYPDDNVIDIIKSGNFDTSKVAGIGEKTIEKIKEKILSNEKYQLAIIRLTSEFGVPYNSIKKLTEKYGSADLLVDKVVNNPYILTEIDGYGFKKADEIAINMGISKKSEFRIEACLNYIIEEEANNGHAWIGRKPLINKAIKLVNLPITDIEQVLNKEGIDYDIKVHKKVVYKGKFFEIENNIKNNIFRLLNEKPKHTYFKVDEIIKHVEEEQGFEFTEEQVEAINYAVEHNVLVVSGKAGTGKTSVVRGIIKVLKTIEGLEYATCALSGKASQRIQEATGLDSYTIHRLLAYLPDIGFTFDEDNPLPHDVVLLDEGSMVNSPLFESLIKAVNTGSKLIITGDVAQLEPIGVGNVLKDILESKVVPSVELTVVHRQAQKSGILSSANKVREGLEFVDKSLKENKVLGELKDLYMKPSINGMDILDKIIKMSKKYKGDIMEYQVIVPMKKRGVVCTEKINVALQKVFNANPSDFADDKKVKRGETFLLEEDKVIINGNNYNKGVFNGTMGMVRFINTKARNEKGVVEGEIVVDFEGVGTIRLTNEEAKNIELAYAISCHKSQGSQWKHVVLGIDFGSYALLNRQLIYTAMTRAEKSLTMVCEMKALTHSIKTDNSSKRRTFLKDSLVRHVA